MVRFPSWIGTTLVLFLLSTCVSSGENHHEMERCASAGHTCRSDSDCGTGICVADVEQPKEDLAPLSLICSCRSKAKDVGHPCQQPSDCSHSICLLTQTCSQPCISDSQCESHQRCIEVFARTSQRALQPFWGCISMVAEADELEVHHEILPDFFSASDEGDRLDLPPIEPTTLFVLEHLSKDAWPAFVTRCRAPICICQLNSNDADPLVLFDVNLYSKPWDTSEQPPLNPVGSGNDAVANQSHPITIMIPNSPRSVLSESGYHVILESEKKGDLSVTDLYKPNPGRLLNLNFFYLGGLDWTIEGQRGPALLDQAIRGVEEIFSQADIKIGMIKQFEVLGGLRERFEFIDQRYGILEELPHLFSLSAGEVSPAINLFFVRQVHDSLAVSGGMPGPMGLHGTGGSGIAFSTDLLDNQNNLTKAIAHEIGHFLGLFHTSEINGQVLDPLPDTQECRLDRDLDGDGQLDPSECEGFGTDNLMFWTISSGTMISADQAKVLQAAPILQ